MKSHLKKCIMGLGLCLWLIVLIITSAFPFRNTQSINVSELHTRLRNHEMSTQVSSEIAPPAAIGTLL
jgi:hypothetical protein